jgi:DNA-binding NarL/FixJ family response regulator
MEEALAGNWREPPSVTLVAIGLTGMSGIEGLKLFRGRYPSVAPLMLTVFEDDDRIFEAIRARLMVARRRLRRS